MTARAIHLVSGHSAGGRVWTLCGIAAPQYWRRPALTNVKGLVTCRRCLRAMDAWRPII